MVTIEPMIFTVRIGEENHDMLDPYTAVCTATRAGTDTVRITGLVGTITVRQAIELSKKLKAMGFEYAIWERLREGKYFDVKRVL